MNFLTKLIKQAEKGEIRQRLENANVRTATCPNCRGSKVISGHEFFGMVTQCPRCNGTGFVTE